MISIKMDVRRSGRYDGTSGRYDGTKCGATQDFLVDSTESDWT
ncbi:MAG: hypothetical protein VXX55_07865 [Planctomycetota bacterium]|nr:hypothetical protein [Planctomycetota bacterium]